jgi:hypothetical protein
MTEGRLRTSFRLGAQGRDWSMPWNKESDARKLGSVTRKSDVWSSAKNGIDRVGRIQLYDQRGGENAYKESCDSN